MTAEELASYIPLKCPLHFVLGIQCPTCGLGRSLCALLLGDLKSSWHFHPLGPALLFSILGFQINRIQRWILSLLNSSFLKS